MLKKALQSLTSMAAPMMSTRLVQTLNTFISMIILSKLGTTVLAASLTIAISRIVLMLIFIAPLFAIGIIVSRRYGTKEQASLNTLLTGSWGLSLLLSVAPLLICFFIGPLLAWAHQPAAVVPLIAHYFNIQCLALPAIMISTVNQQFLSGLNKQHWVLSISLVNLVLNSVLCYGLTLGQLGMPHLGIEGAALSSVIISFVGASASTLIVLKHLPSALRMKHWGRAALKPIKFVLKIGLPICMQLSSEMIVVLLLTIMAGWFGTVAMSANQISSQYMMFCIVPIFGLSEASGIRIGHTQSKETGTTVRHIGQAAYILTGAIVLAFSLFFALFHRPLAGLFIHGHTAHTQAIYTLAMTLLCIQIITMLFDALGDVSVGLLRGLYDTKYPMFLGIICNWLISLPLAYVLSSTLGYGVIGLLIAAGLSRLVFSGFILTRWKTKTKTLN
jgi:multidrug resistance protein, MATE family